MKKLTYEEFGKVMHNVYVHEYFPGVIRLGQAIFNSVYKYYPELANSLRNTGADCFYNDNKIIHFIDAILDK